MRALLALVRVELLRLLRTREVHLFLLLPALLGAPLVGGIALAVSSASSDGLTVALARDLPDDLPLEQSLDQELVRVVVVDDPVASYEAGRVDAAIFAHRRADGVGGHVGTDWEVQLLALGHDPDVRSAVFEAVRRTNRKHVESRVVASGAGEEVSLFHLYWSTDPLEPPPRESGKLRAIVLAYVAFLLGLVSYQIVPIPLVQDRLSGISESFGATPVPRWSLLVARLVATTLVELLAVGVLLLSAWSMLSALVEVPVPSVEGVARAGATLALINALYLLPGIRAASAREAMNLSSVVLLGSGGLLLGGIWGLPAWVPLAGVAAAPPGPAGWVAACSTAAAAVGVVLLAGRLTSPESLLPQGQGR